MGVVISESLRPRYAAGGGRASNISAMKVTDKQRAQHEQWLLEVTGIPTAAGREHRVIEWVKRWVSRRSNLLLQQDRAGNLIISRRAGDGGTTRPKPLYITAHLDHPAFVVRNVIDNRTVELEFRGGVNDPYFENADIEIYNSDDQAHDGRIIAIDSSASPFKIARVQLKNATDSIQSGDVGRWKFRGIGAQPVIQDGLLHTPACDDLAAVAAALAALDVLRNGKGYEHVGVLLTRAEEIGFIGAIAACKYKSVAKDARLICLENSRSYAESPVGGGPILRVGDKSSVFGPLLTNRIAAIMEAHQKNNPPFKWQRKLMPGGTCEATTFSAYGYTSTCLCLPLGNYHNMADIDGVAAGKRPARVAPEYISVGDYHGLIEMLAVTAAMIDRDDVPDLKARMEQLIKERGFVLEQQTSGSSSKTRHAHLK